MVGKTSSDDELDTPDSPGLPNLTPPYRSRSKKSVLKPLTELSDEERAEKLKQQSLTNEYHRFVEGHLILKQGKEQTIFQSNFCLTYHQVNLSYEFARRSTLKLNYCKKIFFSSSIYLPETF